jgi:hypothetical protein
MKRIIYTNEYDRVAIVTTIDKTDSYLEQLKTKLIDDGFLDAEIVDTSILPIDRTFRNAWVKDTVGMKTDLPKAQEIAHEKRRMDRAELFRPLDIEVTIPPMATEAEAKRQLIRDADAQKQIDIDNAATVDELKLLVDTKIVV